MVVGGRVTASNSQEAAFLESPSAQGRLPVPPRVDCRITFPWNVTLCTASHIWGHRDHSTAQGGRGIAHCCLKHCRSSLPLGVAAGPLRTHGLRSGSMGAASPSAVVSDTRDPSPHPCSSKVLIFLKSLNRKLEALIIVTQNKWKSWNCLPFVVWIQVRSGVQVPDGEEGLATPVVSRGGDCSHCLRNRSRYCQHCHTI